jgi:ERF superfamily
MTDSLTAALAAVQADLPIVGKDQKAVVKSDKGNYTYKYANLASVSAAILPLLSKHGFAWTTLPCFDDAGRFVLRYELRHVAGEALSGSYPLPNTGRPHEMGSAITYARRYALCAVTGVAPEEDDDNASAAERSASLRDEREIAVLEAKQLIWAEAEKREWIAEDGTYQALSDDFAHWSEGEGQIETADKATLAAYLTTLRPKTTMQRPKAKS